MALGDGNLLSSDRNSDLAYQHSGFTTTISATFPLPLPCSSRLFSRTNQTKKPSLAFS